ncbi:hypothetical protein BDV95DRAFT_225723 [Massariosphaeria phaeospora]|uniref:Uncharacterized protein n=1 Tax=Massariosphaeria phaeospora TaxID=100035 RepID=A0A7C8MFM9_9PLEO|nr:hypothetical protein BDV95DRAFT_225723 [Massariosphaeria phaeospora]
MLGNRAPAISGSDQLPIHLRKAFSPTRAVDIPCECANGHVCWPLVAWPSNSNMSANVPSSMAWEQQTTTQSPSLRQPWTSTNLPTAVPSFQHVHPTVRCGRGHRHTVHDATAAKACIVMLMAFGFGIGKPLCTHCSTPQGCMLQALLDSVGFSPEPVSHIGRSPGVNESTHTLVT